jgi:hypothetical protein
MLGKKTWVGVFGLALVLGIVFLSANPAPAGEEKGGLYFRGGPGTIFFHPPDLNSFPFYENDAIGNIAGRVQSPLDFEPDDTTAMGELALGYRLNPSQVSPFLGQGLRFEVSSNFYFPEDSDTIVPLSTGILVGGGGALLGAFYSDRGMEGLSLLGFQSAVSPAVESFPRIRFRVDYDYWDLNLGARTDYARLNNCLLISPYAGAIYSRLDQRLSIGAAIPSDADAVTIGSGWAYKVREDLDSYYVGATLGLDFIVRIFEGTTLTLGGSFSPLWAHTDMDIKFQGDRLNTLLITNEKVTTKVDDSESEFTFRATGKAELAYKIRGLKLALLGLVQYWDYVPVVEYPRYSAGDWNAFTPATYPSDVPKIDDETMTNWIIMFTATIFFPWQ